MGSMTYALKLKKILLRYGIKSRPIKSEKNGCSHGLEINNNDFYQAIVIMRKNGINYTVE